MNDEEVDGQANRNGEPEMEQNPIPGPDLQEPSQSNEQPEMADRHKEGKAHKIPESPNRICRVCLTESFLGFESELRGICQDYFGSVFAKLKPYHSNLEIITELILYCQAHHQFDTLWGVIEEVRPDKHKEHYKKWQKAVESMDLTDPFEQTIHEPVSVSPPSTPGDELHPLAVEDYDAISQWFFDQLNQTEKSFVLTVALFEGINQKLFGELAHEVESRLFDTKEQ